MLMEGGPRVVYSWELQLSTNITKPLLRAACHIRPRGWDEETETEPALKQMPSAFWILYSMFRNFTSIIDFRGKGARCVKTIGQLYILVELQEKPPWLAGFMQRIFFSWGRVSLSSSGWSRTYYVHQADLTLTELHLSLLPECWNQRHTTPRLAHGKKFHVIILLKANLNWSRARMI